MKKIHLNHLGYRPEDAKKAVLTLDVADFQLMRVIDDRVAFKGTTGGAVHHAASGEDVRLADFSGFKGKGTFYLQAGDERSYPFAIDDEPYPGLRAALLDFFHYQKCGVQLDCGAWSHPACHTSPATVYGTDEKKDVSGGWHDAGDYGRYIVPAAKAVADLLLAYELAPRPDENVLDVCWFELEWMLKMQDEATGGVYHKVSCRLFDPLDEMPENEKEELILSPISATATADFAAAMALAARFYPSEKDKLLEAAKKAWVWCEKNPDVPGFVNPEDIKTGPYGDKNDKDERFWEACELYAATGLGAFHTYIKESEVYTGLGWANVGTYGIIAYLRLAAQKPGETDAPLVEKMKAAVQAECDKVMALYEKDPYGISLGENFGWGSNMIVANNAMLLLLARPYVSTEKSDIYTSAALAHMHYLLGNNPLSRGYITGFGPNAVKFPHHRPSVAKGQAVPGMVAGGPNRNTQQDPALKEFCEGNAPAKCYIDHKNSYAGNEITIYWNSPAYFVAALLGL